MIIRVKLIPNAKKDEVLEDNQDLFGERFLRARVKAPPENGRANKALLELLADYFKVKNHDLRVFSGFTSRNKYIEIEGC